MIQTQFKKTIQIVRSDNGGEYVNSQMKLFFQTKGIVHQTTCPHTPEQNGVAESQNRILLEMTRALIIESHVLKMFWPEALAITTYLLNRLPTKILKLKTPLETLEEYTEIPPILTLQPKTAYATVRKEAAHQNILGATSNESQGIATGLIVDSSETEGVGLAIKGYRRNDGKKPFVKEDKSHLTCEECGMTKHTKEQCFRIFGYPNWWTDGHKKGTKNLNRRRRRKGFPTIQPSTSNKENTEKGFGGLAAAGNNEKERDFFVTECICLTLLQEHVLLVPKPLDLWILAVLVLLVPEPLNLWILAVLIYTNADWAGDKGTRRSTSGYFSLVGGNLVTWRSKKQKVVALSSAEAEFRGIAKGVAEALWIRKLLSEVGYPRKEVTRIMCDNKAAIQISKNPVQHDRTKHVEIDRHFIKEKLEAGIIKLPFVKSQDQLADILTKSVGAGTLQECLSKLNFGNPTIHRLRKLCQS
nr:putative copia-type protein [Tanacetum cinerariifolium]